MHSASQTLVEDSFVREIRERDRKRKLKGVFYCFLYNVSLPDIN